MVVFHKEFALRRRWLLLLTLLAFAMALGTGGILWQAIETSSISEVQTQFDALKPVLTGIRLLLIALVAMTWPLLVKGFHCWRRINETQAAALRALRWRIVTWLVVIELILGQNLLGQVLAALQGGRA